MNKTKKIETTLVRYLGEDEKDYGYMAYECDMAKTFGAQILKLENQDKSIVVIFQDGSTMSFITLDGKVGFKTDTL